MIWIIICILAVVLATVWIAVLYIKRKQEFTEYYYAAYKIIKEEYLNDAIKKVGSLKQHDTIRRMIGIKKIGKGNQSFVFDPEKIVNIGRSQEGNDLRVGDVRVSGYHCRIFMYQGQIFLEDMQSANGTYVKRGFSTIQVMQPFQLVTGDKLLLGSQIFQICIFDFNMMLL